MKGVARGNYKTVYLKKSGEVKLIFCTRLTSGVLVVSAKVGSEVNLIRPFWHKFTHDFCKLDHFINVNNICSIEMKRYCFEKHYNNINNDFAYNYFICNEYTYNNFTYNDYL
jgi:hypothetical protein